MNVVAGLDRAIHGEPEPERFAAVDRGASVRRRVKPGGDSRESSGIDQLALDLPC